MKLRVWAVSAVALAVFGLLAPRAAQGGEDKKEEKKGAAFKPIRIESSLDENDPKDTKRTNSAAKIHKIKLTEGASYEIRMNSTDFDSFLRIEDEGGQELAFDDDGGGFPNARILFVPKKTASYKVIATSFDAGLGKYTLTIDQKGGAGPAAKLNTKKLQLVKGSATLTGQLQDSDGPNPIGIINGQILKGHTCKMYSVEMKGGTRYTINLDSDEFDAVLILTDAGQKVLAFNDDAKPGETLNSELTYSPTEDGTYTIIATSLDKKLGEFKLRVSSQGGKGGDNKGGKVEAKKLQLNKEGGATVADKLAAGDTPNPYGIVNGQILKGHPSKIYAVEMKGDTNYVINLDSDDFDAVLVLVDTKNNQVVAFNDDANGTLNSEISFRAPGDGTYQIVATSLDKATGDYTLKVRTK